MSADPTPFDLARLTGASRAFAESLFRDVPEAREHASMEGDEPNALHLLVQMPSPTGDPAREIVLWMNGDEPSVGFGTWHTHAGLWDEDDDMARLVRAILDGQFVLVADEQGSIGEWADVIDLREPEELLDALTSPDAPARMRILSWSGREDRELGLSDLEAT